MKWWNALADWTWRNPVTLKELRIGLREKRIFILQILYLFLLLGLSLLMLPHMFDSKNSEQLAESGKEFFLILFWVQLLLLIFTTPALTCGSLSGERERHSLDMVLASRLSSGELVAGKLGFAVYCLILLLSSALPLASICFFLGGVSLGEALSCYLELFLFGMMGAAIGLFSSAREARSNYATVQSYLLVMVGSFCLPLYAALRFDEHNSHLPLGPYWWTFNQVWELGMFHFFVGAASYFIVFLFLKARHRLRPQARTIKAMALSFLAFYLFCLAWLALLSAAQPTGNSPTELDPLALVVYLIHIGALGFFLNPSNLESSSEAALYRASLFSRKIFWLLFFLCGCATPALIHHALGHTVAGFSWGFAYAIFFLLIYPFNVWLVHKSLLPRWQYAWVYYLGLLLLQFLPALGAFAAESDSPWHLYWVSPFLTLVYALTPDKALSGSEFTLELGVAFQLALTLLFSVLVAWRSRRRKLG